MNLIISCIATASFVIAVGATLDTQSAKLSDQSINNSDINLTIEAEEDIYGIQFDIRYNPTELSITKNTIVSKVSGVKIYSRIKENGTARVVMFGMAGEKLLDVTSDRIADIISFHFKPKERFRGTSVVELFDITLAGKAGIKVEINNSQPQTFELSFVTPRNTSLSKNYPNPFNPTTTIDYELSEAGMVSIVIYDLKGAVVKTLVEEHQEENYHSIVWNGLNEGGQSVSSGRYILKMSTHGFSDTITMTLLK